MTPVIALVGRPNVGKSTLFNRLTRSRDALVANLSGLTRDRQYGEGKLGNRDYLVIDTGGISGNEEGIDAMMAGQSLQAIDEADAVLFLVDARAGLTPADEMIAKHLRINNKSAYLVVNKLDGLDADAALADFYQLGLANVEGIAAAHGRGVKTLINKVLDEFPKLEELVELSEEEKAEEQQTAEAEQKAQGIKIGIVGRPNVGKSTLVNRMLGEDRVVVFDHAGTTRDSIYIPFERQEQKYTLIDTAGVRRRGKVKEAVEKFSVVKTLQAISDANVVILVLDAKEGLVDQDLHLLSFILESGRAVVISLNKWDGMDADMKAQVKEELERRLGFINFARIHYISALHGSGVGNLYKSVEEAYQAAMSRWSTNQLTRLLEDAIVEHQPPLVRGNRIKLRYAHMGGSNPPIIVIHGNQTSEVPASYQRYLENTFRRELKIVGTPIRIEFKGSENPYAGKKNKLSDRQVNKKKRLMKHVKKAEHKKKRKKKS
ncbi:ribosome biogenesis GTPase Der [Endozoicomonas sp. SM1973]|uniref:GTPase Der n=1 Tax=Spartinivicinus marinus TaxID=2994442 RepID=A0A853HXX1_9GAMM|nr:ribosome biogenesis GTPase Der [Spartinivicinus marinus]MCX4025552.1 ribosome biogenesis GTPase Der [Spartinivicinus marinus]NYZ65219.1 ribosome biogenesis GTPase Der [Spartinivicinus marinus]